MDDIIGLLRQVQQGSWQRPADKRDLSSLFSKLLRQGQTTYEMPGTERGSAIDPEQDTLPHANPIPRPRHSASMKSSAVSMSTERMNGIRWARMAGP